MKKVGILTINDYNNYGNRLQNYATQEVIKNLGFDVKTIINITNITGKTNQLTNLKEKLTNFKNLTFFELLNKVNYRIYIKIKRDKISKTITKSTNRFKKFTEHFINETSYSISYNNIPEDLSAQFDYFITGSDQIWNPTFKRFSEIDFLTFANRSQRIAYAPSFGISKIPEKYIDNFKKWLNEIDHLSVREEAGAKIIYNLTGKTVEVLIDPTLMFHKEKWLAISKESINKPKEEYILAYFLGGTTNYIIKVLKEIAKRHNLTIVCLANIYYSDHYIVDPSEFIDYINSASLICTNSYHGVIFSILFEKPFIVFDRKAIKKRSMKSRMETLLSTFKLEHRNLENIDNIKNIFDIDYSLVQIILKDERAKTNKFLINSLQVENINKS